MQDPRSGNGPCRPIQCVVGQRIRGRSSPPVFLQGPGGALRQLFQSVMLSMNGRKSCEAKWILESMQCPQVCINSKVRFALYNELLLSIDTGDEARERRSCGVSSYCKYHVPCVTHMLVLRLCRRSHYLLQASVVNQKSFLNAGSHVVIPYPRLARVGARASPHKGITVGTNQLPVR